MFSGGLVFELSGEHPLLPQAEVRSVFMGMGVGLDGVDRYGDLLVVFPDSGVDVSYLVDRVSMVHRVSRFISFESDFAGLVEAASSLSPDGSFCVRASREGGEKDSGVGVVEVESRVGGVVGGVVDLDDPDVVYRVFIVDEGYVLGEQLVDVDRGRFDSWKPTVRPYFSPVGINPRIARLVVNLSRVGRGGFLLDPFVGTGSFVIEGGLVGCNAVGVDVDREMLVGCRRNLEFVGTDADLVYADALDLPFEECSFDAVVADPPYGRSSSVDADSLSGLVGRSVEEMVRVLKEDGYFVLVLPRGIDLMVGADEIESYSLRVHSSLTRVIRIFRRN